MEKTTRILVVDDNPAILETYSEILRMAGYEVWEAATGQQGLQMTRDRRPDLVLLDVMLPDLNGIEVCRQIKQDPALVDVFVVLFSGQATSTPDKVDGLTAGADDYIGRPVAPKEFLARLQVIRRLQHTTAALRESEERYRQVAENIHEVFWMSDIAKKQLFYISPAYEEVWGRTRESLYTSAQDWIEAIHPEDRDRVREAALTKQASGHYDEVYRIFRPDGAIRWIHDRAFPVRDQSGTVYRVVGIAEDITKRKQAEEALRTSEECRSAAETRLVLLGHAVESTTEPICITDLQDRFIFVNAAFEKTYGYTQAEILGQNPTILFAASNPPSLLGEILSQTRGGGWRGEVLDRRKDGTEFPAFLSTSQVKDRDGRVVGLMGVARDISERKRAEEQIRLLADAVESTQELICIGDQQNRFIFANRAFLQAYGYAMEEILGRTPDFLYSPRNPPGLCEQVFRQTLEGTWKGEILNRRKNGTEFPISLITSRIQSREGRMLGLVGVARDITERKRAEKQSAAFAQLGYRLSAVLTREQAANVILEIGSELFGWDAGFVDLYSAEEDKSIALLTVDTLGNQRVPVPPPNRGPDPTPLMRQVMRTGPLLVDRAENPASPVELFPFGDTSRPSACMMYVPIRSGGSAVGVLSIQSYTPLAYSPADLTLLQALADHCGDTLKRIAVTESLSEAEYKFRSIFENATEGIFQTTPDGRIRSANQALAAMLGYPTPKELMASVTDLAAQAYVKPGQREEFKRVIEREGFVKGFEFQHYRKDRSVNWTSINARVVRDASGVATYYEGTFRDITQRKRAEEALEMSQILQTALLDNIPDPAWLKDMEGRFLACNEPLASFLGQRRDRIAGRTLFELDPQRAAQLTEEDNQVIQSGRPTQFEWRRTDAKGRITWFETITSPVIRGSGKVTGTVGIARDITERKWVENLLRVQRDFGIFLSSTNDLTEAAQRLLKYALENQGLDGGAVYLVRSETGALDLAAHQGLSAGFAKRAGRLTLRAAGGKLAAGESSIPRQEDGPMAAMVRRLEREGLVGLEVIPIQHSGQVVAVLSVGARNLREIPAKTCQAVDRLAAQAGGAIARIRAEQSLRAHQQLLEKTLDSVHAAVFILDRRKTRIQACNPAATSIFGYRREEMVGQPPSRLHVNEALAGEFRRRLKAAVAKMGFMDGFEFTMRRKDGTSFPSEHSVVAIRDDAGRIQSWVEVIRDIAERKRTEENLRQSSRRIIEAQEAERQRVARDLHDGVNQLIASVKMRLHKFGEGFARSSPAAREILGRCDRLLVEALEENRRVAHNLRPTDLDALGLADACRNLCKQFESSTGLAVRCSISPFAQRCPPAVELNLFRILQEALNNVHKHARARTVRLRLALQNGSLVLRIQDDGCGFRSKPAKAIRTAGEGVGLTNMQERTAIFGGTCEVVSVPKQGTTITVRVPYSTKD
jgi:PAS domain S-box-containing protein